MIMAVVPGLTCMCLEYTFYAGTAGGSGPAFPFPPGEGDFRIPEYKHQKGRRGHAFARSRKEGFMKRISRLIAVALTLLAITAFLGACGGGGDGGPPAPPPGSGNWDTMKWDVDNWG